MSNFGPREDNRVLSDFGGRGGGDRGLRSETLTLFVCAGELQPMSQFYPRTSRKTIVYFSYQHL